MAIEFNNNDLRVKSISIQGAPCSSDYVLLESYSRWFYGLNNFGSGQNWSKWEAIAFYPTNYIQLELIHAYVGNSVISKCDQVYNDFPNVYVDDVSLTYRNDGYGSEPSNYVDYLNNIFEYFSLNTRLSADDRPGYKANFCKTDIFEFAFKETGVVENGITSPLIYGISSKVLNGYNIIDSINGIAGSYPYVPLNSGVGGVYGWVVV